MTTKKNLKTNKKNKSFDMVKKSYDPNYEGQWSGGTAQRSIFLNQYIKEKYKKDLYFKEFIYLRTMFDPGLIPHQVILIDLTQPEENNFIKITKQSVKKELLPYINAYKNSKKRFHFFDMHMLSRDPDTQEIDSHSVSGLYDKKTHQVDFFNTVQVSVTNMKAYDKQFKTFFQAIYGQDVILNYSFECNYFSIKSDFEEDCWQRYLPKTIPKFIIPGPCAIWTLWFLDMRITNKRVSREKVIEKALKIFNGKDKTMICKVLIDYAVFVDKLTTKYSLIMDKPNRKVDIVLKK